MSNNKGTMEKRSNASLERTTQSHRSGPRATIYDVRRDPALSDKNIIHDKDSHNFPFIRGSTYKGDWRDDMKNGFGCQIGTDGLKYEGEWANNKRHGRGTLYRLKGKKYVRQYVGEWYEGKKTGYGIYYYEDGSVYRGSWQLDKRHGNGRIDQTDGGYFIGEWEDDQKKGFGTLFFANGNVYEGLWLNSFKEGPGRFFYASTQKVYDGEWSDDHPRCGEYREPSSEEIHRFGVSSIRKERFELPELGLQDPHSVLDTSVTQIRVGNAVKRGVAKRLPFTQAHVDEAYVRFKQFDSRDHGYIPWYQAGEVLMTLGLDPDRMDMMGVVEQLGIGQNGDLTFPEIVDIAMCVLGN